ncbi:LOW QUALITY PROTEIN: hypothetical protein BC937DRAFT_91431 [Endogone sp. FLAS-F59071]|nr:LOW QUALITY PROTEIN: hypothetical protein BC937DRAFT_91431 [Endogone sp. FLAS-F59071]|eukprot:RUS16258.1 LOW QUALITY PROTEIN: hypothetical protein BC937DRAFT_91431 [Endogone sp. FLAS-F59071]
MHLPKLKITAFSSIAELYNGLQDAILGGSDLANISSPQHIAQQYQDAIYDHLFLILTYLSPSLPTLSGLKLLKLSYLARLLRSALILSLESLSSNLLYSHILGRVEGRMYVIEFQKQGLPHVHILIILHPDDKPKTVEDINSIVCAEIPNLIQQPYLYNIITNCMIYGPCRPIKPNAQCMKNGKCSKHYPQTFSETTVIDQNGYSIYRYHNNSQTFVKNSFEYNNIWIIPYNPYLSAKYGIYINIEIAISITSVKYLYKYIYKGGDHIIAEIGNQQQIYLCSQSFMVNLPFFYASTQPCYNSTSTPSSRSTYNSL